MQIKFNPTGTHIKNGLLKIRLDLYPDVGDKTYALHHVRLPVYPRPDAPLGGYPGKKTQQAMGWRPDSAAAYQAWVDALPQAWQLNPALCHFITVPEDIKEADLPAYIASVFDKNTVATLDDILKLPPELEAGYQSVKNDLNALAAWHETVLTPYHKSAAGKSYSHLQTHQVSAFMRGKGKFAAQTVKTSDVAGLINSVNAKFSGLVKDAKPGGKIKKVRPESIDVGPGTTDGDTSYPALYTFITPTNPANADGILDIFKLRYLNAGTGVKVGTFYGSGTSWTSRDSETIGDVAAGSEQTFSGKNCDVSANDLVGLYTGATGDSEASSSGSGVQPLYKSGDQFGAGTQTYIQHTLGYDFSIYATGTEPLPTVTTQAASSVEATTATGNGNITNLNGGGNADYRYFVWDTSSHGDPGNVAPAASAYPNHVDEGPGSYGTGAFTESLTSLPSGTTIYARACAHNSLGYGYGAEVSFLTKPAAPTNVAATDGSHTDKVTVTWTKSTGATNYHVWRGAVDLGAAGDVATFDDTGAAAPVITPGAADASDGTSSVHVVLSLAGESVANGTTHTYKVVASNATGNSADSATDTGYRGHGALTYQWQRSAADVDASYSNISGATTDPYNDTGAPADGSGRYYKCVLDATGAAQATSTADRGYRTPPRITSQAVTGIGATSATGNGTITGLGGGSNFDHRGFVYNIATLADPGDVAPAGSGYALYADEPGDFGIGAFTGLLMALSPGITYYARAYGHNSLGYVYGDEVDFTALLSPLAPRNAVTVIIRNESAGTLAYAPDAAPVSTDYRINELPNASFNLPADSLARSYLVRPNQAWFYRDGALLDIFAIARKRKNCSGGANIIAAECYGLGFYLTQDIITSYSATDTPTNILTALLAYQNTARISLGGVSASLNASITINITSLSIDKRNIWEACKLVQSITGGYLYVDFDTADPTSWRLWLSDTLGVNTGQQIRKGKNLNGMEHLTDYQQICNRLYPVGASALNIQKAFTRISPTISQDATYGYIRIPELYAAYKDWTAAGDAVPANVTVEKPIGSWTNPTGHNDSGHWDFAPAGGAYARWMPFYFGYGVPEWGPTAWLDLIFASTTTTQVKFPTWWTADYPDYGIRYASRVEVDIYYGAAWHNIYDAAPYKDTQGELMTVNFSAQTITGVRLRYTNNATSNAWFTKVDVGSVQVWDGTAYASDNTNWKQGADENTLRCLLANFVDGLGYVLSYTHASYLIDLDDLDSREDIISLQQEFSTSDQSTLLELGRTALSGMPKLQSPATSMDLQSVDLSGDEGREFEEIELGSTVRIIHEDLEIDESLQIVRIQRPDLAQRGLMALELGSLVKNLTDLL